MTVFGARTRLAAGIFLCVAIGAGAVAQTKVRDAPAAIRKLIDCRKLTDNPARLACYDAAIDEFTQALTKGDVVAVDKAEVATVRRQAFGFSLPSLTLFDRGDKPAPLQNIAGVVANAYQQGGNAWVIELAEGGGTWLQTDVTESVPRPPHKGSRVEIRKAALGSYFMNIDGQRALRVKRTQ
jgi:hypothetical protein